MKYLQSLEAFDINLLSDTQRSIALSMIHAHVMAQYTRTQQLIDMIRARIADDKDGCNAMEEWREHENREIAALHRNLSNLPDAPAWTFWRGETLN